MIQRIQTIWLLLAGIAALASIKLPFYSGELITDATYKTLNGSSSILLLLVTVAVGVISLVAIFLYNNRGLQTRMCAGAILLEAGCIFLYFKEMKLFSNGTFALTSVIEALVLVFLVLAIRGIRHDEKIVKESNRLR